jgi:hypothetical protein
MGQASFSGTSFSEREGRLSRAAQRRSEMELTPITVAMADEYDLNGAGRQVQLSYSTRLTRGDHVFP